MRLLPRRIKDLLGRVQQARDAKNLAQRSGVRTINADTDEAFDREVERIMREEPPAPGYGYLFVPAQESEETWVLRTTRKTAAEHEDQHRPGDSGPKDQ